MVKVWGPDLMPLKLATQVFKRSERSFWYLRTKGLVEIETLVGAAYVRLSTLKKYMGVSTYEHCMKNQNYDDTRGWKET